MLSASHSGSTVCNDNHGFLITLLCLLVLQSMIKNLPTLPLMVKMLNLFSWYSMTHSDFDYFTLLRNPSLTVSYASSCSLYDTNNSNAHEVPTISLYSFFLKHFTTTSATHSFDSVLHLILTLKYTANILTEHKCFLLQLNSLRVLFSPPVIWGQFLSLTSTTHNSLSIFPFKINLHSKACHLN